MIIRYWLFILLLACGCLFPADVYAEDKILRIAFDKALPPFSSLDSNGEMVGFNIELIRAIAQHNGWELEYVPLDWEDAVTALRTGEVDVLLGMKYTNRYDQVFDFSESFFTMSEVLLVPSYDQEIFTLNQLSEKVVAVQRAHTSMDLLESVRRVKMVVSFSQQEALENLLRGRADAFIGNRWTAEYLLRKENRWDDFTMRSGLINPTDYAFAVREGHSELLDSLNEGLNQLYRDGTYTRLYSKYFEPYSPHLTDWWRKVVAGLLIALAVGVISIATFYTWNKRLQAEVKRQTAALADVLAFQRKVLDHTESSILSLDMDGHITLVNQVAKRMLAVSDESLGWHIVSVLPQLPWETAVQNRHRQYEGEFLWDQESQQIYHYYMAPFINSTHEQVGWIVTLQDRTEQKRMQARLIAQEKMRALGQLVAGIAHELRNPLTAIKTFVELLPKKIDDSRFRTQMLRYVPEEMERMNRILEDLLDYSRTKPLQTHKTSVDELVYSVLGLFTRRMESERIQVCISIPDHLTIDVDRGRVKQVLINLVLNAMESMVASSEKRLNIQAGEGNGEAWLSVKDTGEGMGEEQLRNLFEPFYTSKSQGIGLGLYVSQKIMREHSARMEVSSEVRAGTTFTLRFEQEDSDAKLVDCR
ncbi:transporter substrate-binding domain-containing protein [Brevibacillus choshinensis]|uniref:transporter substrate-binding domain-containing protein n=1 Tax=Brevibacillus choshinensis TaxID=54911 RepID=UPI000AE65EC8|nr:transporter substrate-binding domain-containing protein [Brevibacillus choshinensis]